MWQAINEQLRVSCRRISTVAHELVDRHPGELAQEPVRDRLKSRLSEAERCLVEAKLADGEVIVVWDHRQWEWPPGGARHVGACPRHQGLVRLNGDHLPIARIEERDAEEVLTQHVVARDNLLDDRQVADGAVRAWGNQRAESVGPTGTQPLCRPVGERDATPLFE